MWLKSRLSIALLAGLLATGALLSLPGRSPPPGGHAHSGSKQSLGAAAEAGDLSSPSMQPDARHIRIALRNRFFTDGNIGVFLDDPAGLLGVMSLYETRWSVRLELLMGGVPSVEPSVVAKWLLPLLEDPHSDGADTAGVSRLAVLGAGIALAGDLGIAVPDTSSVVRQIESLRRENGYGATADSDTWDWSSTAISVAVLHSLNAPIPAPVRHAVRVRANQVLRAASVSIPADELLGLMRASMTVGIDPRVWRGRAVGLLTGLQRVEGEELLLTLGALREIQPEIFSRRIRADACRRIAEGPSLYRERDSHLYADAWSLGCLREAKERRLSGPGGWPSHRAVSDAASTTYYGAALARHIGHLDEFAPALRRTLKHPPGVGPWHRTAALLGCRRSECGLDGLDRPTSDGQVIQALAECLIVDDAAATAPTVHAAREVENVLLRMVALELASRCRYIRSAHVEALQLRLLFRGSRVPEVIGLAAWASGKPPREQELRQMLQPGELQLLVLRLHPYGSLKMLPPIAL